MTIFFADEHPREKTGKFVDKLNSAPETGLRHELPYVPGTLGGYSLEHFAAGGAGHEGGGFAGALLLDGTHILTVSNSGNDSETRYLSPAGEPAELTEQQQQQQHEALTRFTSTARRLHGGTGDVGDSFLGCIRLVGTFQETADQFGLSYAEAVDAGYRLFLVLSDEQKTLIRNPESVGR